MRPAAKFLMCVALAVAILFARGNATLINLSQPQVVGTLGESNGGTGGTTYQRTTLEGHCTGTASTATALGLFGLGAAASTCTVTTTTNVGAVMTQPGTVKNLFVQEGTSQKSGTTMAWTAQLCHAGSCSAQTLTCTVSNGATSCSDVTHSFSVAQGDVVQIKSGSTASASETLANPNVSMEFWN